MCVDLCTLSAHTGTGKYLWKTMEPKCCYISRVDLMTRLTKPENARWVGFFFGSQIFHAFAKRKPLFWGISTGLEFRNKWQARGYLAGH